MWNRQFLVSQLQIHPSLPCFVILKLDAVNFSPLLAGLILGFVNRNCCWFFVRSQQERRGFLFGIFIIFFLAPQLANEHVGGPVALTSVALTSVALLDKLQLIHTLWQMSLPCSGPILQISSSQPIPCRKFLSHPLGCSQEPALALAPWQVSSLQGRLFLRQHTPYNEV